MITAAWDTDVTCWAMRVSVRARLPTSRAWRNNRLRLRRAVPSVRATSHASRTWPRISCSPGHRGVDAGDDLEEVADRIVVVVDVEAVGEVLGRQEGEVGEEVAHLLVRAVEPLGDDVHLGAVAGRQDDDLGGVLALGQARSAAWEGGRRTRPSARGASSGAVRWFAPTTTTDTPSGAPWQRLDGPDGSPPAWSGRAQTASQRTRPDPASSARTSATSLDPHSPTARRSRSSDRSRRVPGPRRGTAFGGPPGHRRGPAVARHRDPQGPGPITAGMRRSPERGVIGPVHERARRFGGVLDHLVDLGRVGCGDHDDGAVGVRGSETPVSE